MEELRQLTLGQRAIVDAYLVNCEPAETYDAETCELRDTDTIIFELGAMCSFDANMLADYLARQGYRPHFIPYDAVYGWILKEKE